MTSRKAVGFLRLDISGSRSVWDDRAITNYAASHDIELAQTLCVPENAIDPTMRLISAMNRHDGASIVIVPSLIHIDGTKRAITEQWELRAVDKGTVWPRGFRWPSTATTQTFHPRRGADGGG